MFFAGLCDANANKVFYFLTVEKSHCRDQAVVDNEGLGRKSSKRCCIFHKQRKFGESSTDSSDASDSDGSSSSGGPDSETKKPGNGKIARKKRGDAKKKKIPDYQRFHA
jgi:protein phosphatase 1 regulatory subunit 11